MATVWTSDSGGVGPAVLVLHPGGTDSRSMGPLVDELTGYRVLLVDMPGHGRSADVAGPWHLADMASVAARVIEDAGVGPLHVVGWSDGALVGLHLAMTRPELVRSLVFGGAPFAVDGWHDGVLDEADPPAFMADSYAEVSPDGREHWPVVVVKSAAMHAVEPAWTTGDLATLGIPVLIVCGDDDEVRLGHLATMLEAVPDAELAVVPRATHGLIVEQPRLLAELVRTFHAPGRSDGIAPRRRAAPGR